MCDKTDCRRQPPLSKLGTDLLRLTMWQRTRVIAWPFIAFGSYWLCAWNGHWGLAVMSLVALSFLTYGSTSHDLVHGSLGLTKIPNDLLLCITEGICLRSGHAYQAAHLNHHARFPHEDDIEAEAAGMTLAGALAQGIFFQLRIYGWALRHSRTGRMWVIAEGIGVCAFVLGTIAALPWTTVPALYVALMIVGSWIIPFVTAYLPHDPKAVDALHQTRLFRGVLIRFLAFDHLYHLEHHLYPAVPHQNWPRLAQRLDPWFEEMGITPVQVGRSRD